MTRIQILTQSEKAVYLDLGNEKRWVPKKACKFVLYAFIQRATVSGFDVFWENIYEETGDIQRIKDKVRIITRIDIPDMSTLLFGEYVKDKEYKVFFEYMVTEISGWALKR